MATSPKRDAAKALYNAIELVLHKECEKYTGEAKNAFRYHVQRHTAKLLPKLAKAAGMYTSEKDILKVVRSLFLDDLRQEFEEIKSDNGLLDLLVALMRLAGKLDLDRRERIEQAAFAFGPFL